MKVLLVDDSGAIQKSFGALLEAALGVVVVGYAEDVAGAVAFIASNPPDPSAIPMRHSCVLVEAVAFLAEHFAAVTTIRVSLSSPIERHDDFPKVARNRAQLLHRIGAQQINIIPNFVPSNRGNFTVTGVWKRNPQSLKALNAALRHEREAHRSRTAAETTVRGRLAKLSVRIRRLLSGSTKKRI